MRNLKPGCGALMLSLVLLPAGAQEGAQQKAQEQAQEGAPAAPVPEYRHAPRPQTEPEASQVVPNPRPNPVRRRSVPQAIEPTPRIAADAYRPTLEVRPPAAIPAPAAAPAPAPVPGPVLMNSCDAGGCFDTSGARYNGGVGNTLIGPTGQLCTKGVVNAQCN